MSPVPPCTVLLLAAMPFRRKSAKKGVLNCGRGYDLVTFTNYAFVDALIHLLPAEKQEEFRHISRGGSGRSGPPPPWNCQKIHYGEQHFKIFGLIRGIFVSAFKNLPTRFARLLLYLKKNMYHSKRMKVHLCPVTIVRTDCVGHNNVDKLSASLQYCQTPWHIPVHPYPGENVKLQMYV